MSEDLSEGTAAGPRPDAATPVPAVPEPALPAEPSEPARRSPRRWTRRDMKIQEILAAVAGFGLLTFLWVTIFYSDATSGAVILPVFPLAALLYFLYPFRRVTVVRRTMLLAIFSFLIWLSISLSGVLFPFIIALLLAYICAPVIRRFEENGIARWITSLGIVVLLLSIYVVVFVFIVPGLISEGSQLWTSAQGLLADANSLLDREKLVKRLTRYGLPEKQAAELVTNQIQPQIQAVVSWLFGSILSLAQNISTILEGVFNLLAIPLLTFYMLIDYPRLRRFIRATVLRDDPRHVYLVKGIDSILNAYLRGILTTSTIVAILATAILITFDVPYAIGIGLLTGVFNLIPTLGMFMNLGVAIVIYAFAPGDFMTNTLITAGMIGFLHALNSYLIEPRIVGSNVGLHPVLMIASLFAFGYFLGFIGLLIAVPTTAVLMMFLKEWYRRSVGPAEQIAPVAEH